MLSIIARNTQYSRKTCASCLRKRIRKDLHVYVSHTLDAWFRYLLATGSDNAGRVGGVTFFNWMRSLHAKFDEYQSVLTADVVLESVFL